MKTIRDGGSSRDYQTIRHMKMVVDGSTRTMMRRLPKEIGYQKTS